MRAHLLAAALLLAALLLADGGVEAEAAADLPGEHVLDGALVEQAAALEAVA